MTWDGTRTFEWDARNQPVRVVNGAYGSEFTYNATGDRVRIEETNGSVTEAGRIFVPCGGMAYDERDVNGASRRWL
jgi:YD repeat-containing protein